MHLDDCAHWVREMAAAAKVGPVEPDADLTYSELLDHVDDLLVDIGRSVNSIQASKALANQNQHIGETRT